MPPGSIIHPGDVTCWKTEKRPDNLPHVPPHFLPKRMPGVQPPLSVHVDNPSPSELFRMYFDWAAVKTLCANTNKNAAKSHDWNFSQLFRRYAEESIQSRSFFKNAAGDIDPVVMTNVHNRGHEIETLMLIPVYLLNPPSKDIFFCERLSRYEN